MGLCSKIAEDPSNRLIIFESFPKWALEFGSAKFLEIPKSWIVETAKTVDLENTWIRHETAFSVLHGDIISQFLKQNRNCTFLINNDDTEAIAFFTYSVIYKFYRHRYDMLRKGYPIKERIYFVIEEAQNSLNNQVGSKLFRQYRKLFSEMRNMQLYSILITQRIQDLATFFRCRCSLGIGKIALDDWDLKIKRLLSPIKDKERILNMPKGSFFFTATNQIIAFPLFKPSKPSEFKQPIQQPTQQPTQQKTQSEKWQSWNPIKKAFMLLGAILTASTANTKEDNIEEAETNEDEKFDFIALNDDELMFSETD